MTQTLQQIALHANRVTRACLEQCNGDVESALMAAEYILATQPIDAALAFNPEEQHDKIEKWSINAFFAHDIHNRKAQGILNRSLKAAKNLSATARKDLTAALKRGTTDSGAAILKFIDKYRIQLARLLTTTQLASVLEGAREVAQDVPPLASFAGAVPPPPSLEPKQAVALVDKLHDIEDATIRAKAVYDLPPAQQTYVQQALAMKSAGPPPTPPTFHTTASGPNDIHFPTIDEAVKHLNEKNVLTRDVYDQLDAAVRAKSFTVANVTAQETLTKIRDSLAENVKEGADYETWKGKVLQDVEQGTFLSDAHQETVFRTTVQTAFSDGQMTVIQHPLVRSGFPYSAYDSIHDDRVREEHKELDTLGIGGTNIYRTDDPVFQTFRPPWSYNCRCSWTPMTVRQAAEAGIDEAKRWLDTGAEPAEKAFVKMPDFAPPPGFQRAVLSAPLSIQMSLQSIAMFGFDSNEKRDASGEWTSDSTDSTKFGDVSHQIPSNEHFSAQTIYTYVGRREGDSYRVVAQVPHACAGHTRHCR